MPQTKNSFDRLKKLDELLSETDRKYTIGDLTKKVNDMLYDHGEATVTQRCIQKDLYFIDYVCSKELVRKIDNYGCHIIKYKADVEPIFTKKLTSDERNLIKELFHLVGQFEGLPCFDNIERRRKNILSEDTDTEYNPVVSFTKNPLMNSNLFGELYTAISQKQAIRLHYHTFKNQTEEKTVEVYPYLLKENNRRWYLFCACAPNQDGKILNFALDRIDSFEPLPSEHYEDYKGDWDEYFKNIIGVTNYDNEKTQKILFWVSDDNNSKDYISTKPIHATQNPIEDDKLERTKYPKLRGGGFFTIECKYNYELIRELCSYGKNLIVLSPESIRAKVWKRVYEMYEAYNQ